MACSINGKAIAAFATFCTVLVYLAVGAAIFQAIEESHENEQRKSYEDEVCHVLDLFRIKFSFEICVLFSLMF